ncbi:hypothetical protein CJ20_123 [Escherichia phage CJ20]|nr:hypothetical protein CJ20_123 [Escherichia phage CJ20]
MFMTTYFDTRKNFCEVVFSKASPGVPADKQPTKESIKNYADIVCPVEFRTVNGRDTLAITKLSRDIDIDPIAAREVNSSDINGGNVKSHGFQMRF